MNVTLGEKNMRRHFGLHFKDFKCVYMSNTLCSANSKLVFQLHSQLMGYWKLCSCEAVLQCV